MFYNPQIQPFAGLRGESTPRRYTNPRLPLPFTFICTSST